MNFLTEKLLAFADVEGTVCDFLYGAVLPRSLIGKVKQVSSILMGPNSLLRICQGTTLRLSFKKQLKTYLFKQAYCELRKHF